MNKLQYLKFHTAACQRMIEITQRKNADYSGAGDDPFANFRHVGNFVQGQKLDMVAIGFLTRMSDKFSRIGSFITNDQLQVKEESVADTLLDLANYSILFMGYLQSKQQPTKGEFHGQEEGKNN